MESFLPKHSSSGPALNPGGQMSFLAEGVVTSAASVTAPWTASITGFPGFPAHLYPPMVFSQRYFGQGGRGNWHSFISKDIK